MRLGQRILLAAVVVGLVTWAAIPLFNSIGLGGILSLDFSLARSVIDEFVGRLAILTSFLAGAVLISHALGRLRWSELRTRQLDQLLGTARDVVPFRHDQNDRYALLKEACGRLRVTRGYESVWIASVDERGAGMLAVQNGCKGAFGALTEDMKRGSWPVCAEQALGKSGPVLIKDTVAQCAGCHLHERRYGHAAVALRLETEGKVYGVLCVKSALAALSKNEEQGVLSRVGKDLAYALSAIELRMRHGQTADELRWRAALGQAVGQCIVASIGSRLPLKPVAAATLDNVVRLTESSAAAAYRIDERTGTAVLVAARDAEGELPPERLAFPAEIARNGADGFEGVWGRALNGEGTVVENELRERGTAAAAGGGVDRPFRLMAVPAVADGSVVGQIVAIDSDTLYAERDRQAAETLATYYADACRDTQREEDLAVREEAMSESPSSILMTAPDGRVTYANRSMCRVWGFDEPAVVVGTDYRALWDDSSIAEELLRKLEETGGWEGELEGRRTDGGYVRVNVRATVSGGGGELPARYVYAIADLTEARLSDATLRAFGRIAARAGSSEQSRELFLETRQELGRVMDTRNFLVALYDSERDTLTLPFFLDEKDQDQFAELPAGKTLSAYVIRTRKPLLVTSRAVDNMVSRGDVEVVGSPCECWLGVPILVDDEPAGVIAVQSYSDPAEYGDRELDTLRHASDLVAAGLARIRAQGVLNRDRGRMNAVAQTVTDALVDTDSQGRILSWNRAAETTFGYSAAEAIGQPFSMIVPEGFLQAHVDGLMRAVSSEGQGYVRASVEGVGLRKDESEFPMELSIGAWRAGDETYFTAVLSDATERKQTAEELQFLSSIPQQVSDALIVTDLNFRITYVNKAAEFLFSYSREELIGRTLDVLSVDSWEEGKSDEIHQTVSAGRFWSGSQRSRRKGGSSFVVEYRVSPLRDRSGRLTSYISIFHDITDRRRGEQILQALNAAALGMERSITPNQVLEAVGNELEAIGLSCAVLALDGASEALNLTYSSPGVGLGGVTSTTDGRPPRPREVPLDSLPALRRAVEQKRAVLLEKGSSDETVRAEGAEWLRDALVGRSSVVAPLTAGRDVVGVLAVMSDSLARRDIPAITAFGNQLAAAWRKANLMQELESSLKELRRTQTILLHAQKMEAIGNLAGGVAHDFNNLLTAIHGYTELLLDRFEAGDPTHADLMEIKKASEQAAGVTGQLLAFSRQQPLEQKPVLVNDVVTNIDKMLRRLIGEDVDLVTVLDPDLGKVKADLTQLQQVIMNLAINARDAMPDGGTLTLRTENVHLGEGDVQSTTDAEPGEYVRLSVSDTGSGVDPEVLDRIFEPFFTTKESGKGTGLGLSVVYGIVSQHRGWVDVSSELHKGTAFSVYLPVTTGDAGERETENRTRKGARGNDERVLIVEDEDSVRGFAVRALRQGGYNVLEARSAEEAVELFRAEGSRIDLIFTDVVLSSRSGLELVDEIHEMRPNVPALLSSGYADQKSHWDTIQERGLPFLKKPYAVSDLLDRVRSVIEEGSVADRDASDHSHGE
ncbi:MAG: PAS domain S-box protein [Candidatus Eisenbacteria bacterium]